jgi:hypothetical protein
MGEFLVGRVPGEMATDATTFSTLRADDVANVPAAPGGGGGGGGGGGFPLDEIGGGGVPLDAVKGGPSADAHNVSTATLADAVVAKLGNATEPLQVIILGGGLLAVGLYTLNPS